MPLYEYQCEQCGATFEVIQKFSDAPVGTCRTCGGPVRRLLSAPAIQFKGTGWYITDYARKSAGGAESDKAPTPTSTPPTTTESKGAGAATPTPTAASTTQSSDKK